eukprot:2483723-Pyramimonas_sp.AAC.1
MNRVVMGVLAGCSCCCELLFGVKGVTGGKMLGLGVGCSVGMGESAAIVRVVGFADRDAVTVCPHVEQPLFPSLHGDDPLFFAQPQVVQVAEWVDAGVLLEGRAQ